MGFNPDYAQTIGPQWQPPTADTFTADAPGKALGMLIPSTVTESIDSIWVPVGQVVGSPLMVVEVYQLDEAEGALTAAQLFAAGGAPLLPNADVLEASVTGSPDSTNLYTNVDDAAFYTGPVQVGDDYVILNVGETYSARLETGTPDFTGKRVVGMRFRWSLQSAGVLAPYRQYRPFIEIGGVTYYTTPAAFVGSAAGSTQDKWFAHALDHAVNPATSRAWTVAELQAFEASGGSMGVTGSGATAHVNAMRAEVAYADENRVAQGSATPTAAGWCEVDLAATWSKTAGVNYVVVVRPQGGPYSGWYVINTFSTGQPSVSGHRTYRPTVADGSGWIGPDGLGAPRVDLFGLVMSNTGGTVVSVDSQPYWKLVPVAIEAGRVLRQYFPVVTTDDYGFITAVAAQQQAVVPSDLVVTPMDDTLVVLGAAATVVANSTLVEPFTVPQSVGISLPAAVSFPGSETSVLEWSSDGAVGAGYWLWYLTSDDGTTDFATITVGGDDHYAEIEDGAGIVTLLAADVLATIATVPDPLTSFAVVVVDGVAEISWANPSSLGASFDHTVIERLDPLTGWKPIAAIDDEALTAFDDKELRRSLATSYRGARVRVDGSRADWTAPDTGNIAESVGRRWAIVTNEADGLDLAIRLIAQDLSFTPIEHTLEVEFWGRNYGVVYGENNTRGDTFTFTVLYDETEGGREVFRRLERIARASQDTLSYACLLAPDGGRWFCKIWVEDLPIVDNGQTYLARLRVREVSGEPSTPTVST